MATLPRDGEVQELLEGFGRGALDLLIQTVQGPVLLAAASGRADGHVREDEVPRGTGSNGQWMATIPTGLLNLQSVTN